MRPKYRVRDYCILGIMRRPLMCSAVSSTTSNTRSPMALVTAQSSAETLLLGARISEALWWHDC